MTTHVLHRQLGRSWPIAVSGSGCTLTDSEGRTYLDASGGAAVSCLGHAHPDVIAAMHAQIDRLAYAHTSFFTTEVAEALADDLIAARAARHEPRLLRQRRLRGDRGGAEDGAPVLRRDRPAAAAPLHRAAAELPRQHAGRAGGRRQRMAAAPVRAAADPGDARVAVLRVPRPRADETPEAYGARLVERARGGDRRARRRPGDRVRRRDGGRRHRRRADAGARLLARRARALRPPRHPADPRRGDVRHGPHRHAARLRAGRRGARSAGRSPRGWAAATSRSARCWRKRASSRQSRAAAACSSTATPTSAIRSPAPRRWPCSR